MIRSKLLFTLLLCSSFFQTAWGQWSKVPSGTDVNFFSVDMLSPQHAFAIGWKGDNSALLYTNDYGATWRKTDMPQSYMFDVDFQDSMKGYVAGYDYGCTCGYIRYTEDGGATTNPALLSVYIMW